MIRISNIQLFVLIFIFEVGSTTLFALGIGAKQDAWIVILIAALVGLGLLWVYTEIPKYYPNQDFSEILNDVVGKKAAKLLLFLFGIYFFDVASHNFFEFGALIQMTALPQTPLIVILYIFIIVLIYLLHMGFEVLARTAELLLPYMLLFLISIFILALFSGQFDFDALRPVLGNGIKPVIQELLKVRVLSFPFGEMVVFMMFWHYVKNQQTLRKTAFLAVCLSALLLIISLIEMIAILGPELAAQSEIPLLEVILAINIAEIITNLDSIAVFIMFIGGFYKTAIHFYAYTLAMTWLFNVKEMKWILIISGLFFPLYNLYRFPGLDVKKWLGIGVTTYDIPIFSIMPILLLLIILIKKRQKSS
ncbi:GerAB/ArcD/ProY family transporter [Alkalihalobacillus sp. BA299]|uniref:GerAB/ArcD/ProY family transporter n=1 Tax=Alkalihalobacillus sp. BA299 TaxID=2815938 RepID=UPI001ADD3270|nr:GerAB/ArcD/ProY family transporter [Alkalihalobacillus sp. BA299]